MGAPLTEAEATKLQSLFIPTVAPGLSDAELNAVERRFGFRFAPDHRVFLRAGLPVGPGWPNWREAESPSLRDQVTEPIRGLLFDVANNGLWLPEWGRRPAAAQAALDVAREQVARAPRLVPVYRHRYLPGIANSWGMPVLSVSQSDIIVYGANLADYLRVEFGRSAPGEPSATVPFWSTWYE